MRPYSITLHLDVDMVFVGSYTNIFGTLSCICEFILKSKLFRIVIQGMFLAFQLKCFMLKIIYSENKNKRTCTYIF